MRKQRQLFKKHQFKKRAGFTDDHHLRPSSRGGQSIHSNLLRIDAYRHDAIHLLFGNHTLDEIIEILLRLRRIKNSQRIHKRIY